MNRDNNRPEKPSIKARITLAAAITLSAFIGIIAILAYAIPIVSNQYVTAEATITGYDNIPIGKTADGVEYYRPKLEYKDSAGNTYISLSLTGLPKSDSYIGTKVTIYYDKDRPYTATESKPGMPFGLVIFGIISFLVALNLVGVVCILTRAEKKAYGIQDTKKGEKK